MIVSEKSFAGYGTYYAAHKRPANRVSIAQAFSTFISEINAKIDLHRPVFETAKNGRSSIVHTGSRAKVVDLVGAKVARRLGR